MNTQKKWIVTAMVLAVILAVLVVGLLLAARNAYDLRTARMTGKSIAIEGGTKFTDFGAAAWIQGKELTAGAKIVTAMAPVDRVEAVYPEGKVIYLTFDDGPGADTKRLLEVLAKYDVKATFFVVGTADISMLKDIADQGHAIGVHAYHHDYKEIYASEEAYFEDLLAMQQLIYDHTGVYTTLVRFPGGGSNTVSRFNPGIMSRLTQAVQDMGFRYFDWNVDSNDAGGAKDAATVAANVIAGCGVRRVSVVLQHDTKGYSVDAVERIILWGLANGYTFLPMDSTSPTMHHGINN